MISFTSITTTVFSPDVILSGQVIDYDGKPLDAVHIKVEASDGVILDRVLELKPGGEVSVSLGAVKQDLVRCYISANGFETAQITAVVQGDRALLGKVKLKRYIDLGPIEVLRVADGQVVYLDFWITSQTLQPLIIRQVGIKGEKPRQGLCFENTPRISFQFKNIEVKGNSNNPGKHKLRVSILIQEDKRSRNCFSSRGSFLS
jgi:hypothetical protein